ncbi:MAG: cell division protein FtsQ/DivIB [Lachnospiraceae bacterium]|nr:cell division protein FtsQ/DivIB [Lachnospiraceae bacterium]
MERSFSRKKFIGISLLVVLLILAGTVYYLLTEYKVTDVMVEGNIHYTPAEIRDMVLPGGIKDNSLYLRLYFRNRKMEDIPFIETMDVEIMSHNMIKVVVYEKALAGCIEYLGKYMYFDKDGVVVESSDQTTPGVPQIKGLTFDSVMLHEPLPVGNSDIFSEILKVTQLLDKYQLTADQIFFSNKGNVTLYFGNVRVDMGGEANVDEKVMQLREIIPHLEGKSGILHMENFNKETTTVTFVPDDAPGARMPEEEASDQMPDLLQGIAIEDGEGVSDGVSEEETTGEGAEEADPAKQQSDAAGAEEKKPETAQQENGEGSQKKTEEKKTEEKKTETTQSDSVQTSEGTQAAETVGGQKTDTTQPSTQSTDGGEGAKSTDGEAAGTDGGALQQQESQQENTVQLPSDILP